MRAAIEVLCDEAPDDVYQLENWGAVFSRTDDGRIAQRPFGAAGEPRTAYAADITGHVLVHVLYEQVMKRDLKVYEEFFVWKLIVDDDRCQGVIAWNLIDGGLASIGAKTVILATGGAARAPTYSTPRATAFSSSTRRTRWSSPHATSSRARSRPRSTTGAASTGTSSSTCATSGPRRSSSVCTGRGSCRWSSRESTPSTSR